MNARERVLAILNYKNFDSIPIIHFGFWSETLEKWFNEGHLEKDEWQNWHDGNNYDKKYDKKISEKLGFDFNWNTCAGVNTGLFPAFKEEVAGKNITFQSCNIARSELILKLLNLG